jgi:hypothetical protein
MKRRSNCLNSSIAESACSNRDNTFRDLSHSIRHSDEPAPLPAAVVAREELAAMSDTRPMTPEQEATLKQLAKAAYELDAFKPNLTRTEADIRIAALKAKLKLLNGPPHTL